MADIKIGLLAILITSSVLIQTGCKLIPDDFFRLIDSIPKSLAENPAPEQRYQQYDASSNYKK